MAKIQRLPGEMMTEICEALGIEAVLVGRLEIDIKPDRIQVVATVHRTDALGHPFTELMTSTDWRRQSKHNHHAFNPTRCDLYGGQVGAPAHANKVHATPEIDDGFPTATCSAPGQPHPAQIGSRGVCTCGHTKDSDCHV